MQPNAKRSLRNRVKNRLVAAAVPVVERVESRIFMSATVAGWNFDSYTPIVTTPNLSPSPSTGSGTALTVGMQTSSSNTSSPGGVYAYPNANASGTGDNSDVLNGTGNNPPATTDNSSTGQTGSGDATGINPAWRVRGNGDGWSSNAAIGSQGAQFAASTVGYSGISLSFDLDPSSASAPSEIQVQYTTDGTNWVNATSLTKPTAANGATDGVTIATNTTATNPNIVNGSYFQIANNADGLFWQNGFKADFSSVTAANNNPNFAVRIVNAATGTAEFEVGGTAFPMAGAGNWRLDNVNIIAQGNVSAAPSINPGGNPANQNVPAGQPVTFTASASGFPVPTVQWYKGAVGSGTAISGATSSSYTFTTSLTAADNGTSYYAVFTNTNGTASTTAATLTDTLAAPVVTTPPANTSVFAGNPVSFTAAASGSPVPTVQWQSEAVGATSYTNISGATSTTYSIPTALISASGTKYEAVFTNSQGSVTSVPATLTVTVAPVALWNFNGLTAAVNSAPTPTLGTGTASSVGFGASALSGVVTLGTQTSGNYSLNFADSTGNHTVSGLAYNGNATTIQTAIDNSAASLGNITVSGSVGGPFTIAMGSDPTAVLTGNGTNLTTPANFSTSQGTTPYPTSGATGYDASAIGSDASPDPSTTNPEDWKLVGGPAKPNNGWNTAAGIGTQGAQFLVPTTGFSNISLSFDWGVSGTTANGQLAVEYTLNANATTPTWTIAPSISIPAADTNTVLTTNVSTPNVIQGTFFQNAGSASWQGGLTADFSSVTGANNNPNFGIRLVNAATGAEAVGGVSGNITSASESGNTVTIHGGNGTYVAGQLVTVSGLPTGYNGSYQVVTGGNGTFTYTDSTGGLATPSSYTGSFATGATAPSNTSANWRIDEVQINGTGTAPAITTQPNSLTVAPGSPATFTAAASGGPAPTVQWEVSTNGGASFSNISGATSATYTIPAVTSLQNGNEYEAVFTNIQATGPATATTNVVTLNVPPTVAPQPGSVNVAAGTSLSTVSFTSGATGTPTPTVQWQISTNGGSSFTNISGATSATYTLSGTATENLSGEEFQAVWTNTGGTTISSPATLTVTGTPIVQWNFTSGESPTAQSTAQGTANNPYPTYGSAANNSAQPYGLSNLYGAVQSYPEADILPSISATNPNFSEYIWRVRGGSGTGPTGTPGTPDGWSQLAPQYTQGVEYDINTVGYSNITFHFDWNEANIGDMQPQYNSGNSTSPNWVNIPNSLIVSNTSDYAGITSTTTPTGILVNLQGLAAANNNPNFQFRLAAAYNTSLPSIVDGNTLDATLHGEYSSAGTPSIVGSQQLLTIPDGVTTGTLTFNGLTTGNITFNADAVTADANTTAKAIANALNGLTGMSGDFTVSTPADDSSGALYTVSLKSGLTTAQESALITTNFETSLLAVGVQTSGNYTLTVTSGGTTYTTPSLAYNATAATVQSALRALAAPGASSFTAVNSGDMNIPGSYPMYAVGLGSGETLSATSVGLSTPSNIVVVAPSQLMRAATTTATGVSVYSDGSGSWSLGNMTFSGDAISGVGITANPSSQTVAATYPVTLTASAYSDAGLTGAQWQISTNGGSSFTNIPGATNLVGNTSTYTFTPSAALEGANPAPEYQCVFSSGTNSGTTTPATLTVVPPVAPTVTVNPTNQSAPGGQVEVFTATATAQPAPTVQWELFSSNGTFLQDLNSSATVVIANANGTGLLQSTLSYRTNANLSENGDQVEAVFSNAVGTTASSAATLTVLGPESVITDWNFASPIYADPNDNSPVPTIGNGVASIVGMTLPSVSTYNGVLDPAAQSPDGTGSYASGDIASSPNNLGNFSENTWRIRGGQDQTLNVTGAVLTSNVATFTVSSSPASIPLHSTVTVSGLSSAYNGNFTVIGVGNSTISVTDTHADIASSGNLTGSILGTGPSGATPGGTPANGWSNNVPEFTQGAQFTSSSQGYNNIYVTMDWYSTTSGELDAQEQYTTGGTVAPITAVSRTSSVATITAANSYATDETVTITGMSGAQSDLNGTFTILSANSSSFTISKNGAASSTTPVSATATVQWMNVPNGHVQAVSNDFYGGSANESGAPIPLVINLTGISAASNNPNLGVRLVNAYNQVLTTANGGVGTYANAALVGTPPGPAAYNGSKGNWRFDNIEFHGVPDWLSDNSQATYLPATTSTLASAITSSATTLTLAPGAGLTMPAVPFQATIGTGATTESVEVTAISGDTLTVTRGSGPLAWGSGATFTSAATLNVTGPAKIIADPETLPTVAINGSLGNIPVDPNIVGTTSAAQLLIQPLTSNVDVHVGGITLANGAGIDMASVLGVGQGGLNGVERAQGANNVLVVGQVDQTTAPTFSIDSLSNLNLEDNDLIIHGDTPNADGTNPLFASVQAAQQAGRNGGSWVSTNGLTSTAAANQNANDGSETVQLAPVFNGDLGGNQYSNWTVGSAVEPLSATGNDIIVKYTYTGDFNLDGRVDGTDLGIIDNNYLLNPTGNEWALGDTNGDGAVDGTDLGIIDNLYGNGTALTDPALAAGAIDPNAL
jgi:hypothetical protein